MSTGRLSGAVLACALAIGCAALFLRGGFRILVICLAGGYLVGLIWSLFLPGSKVTDENVEETMERARNYPIVGPLIGLGFWWMGAGRRSRRRGRKP